MINDFYYSGQIRSYLLQFCAIFTGLQVEFGKDASGKTSRVKVPICVGNRDRVVAALGVGNTKNMTFSLPTMAVDISSIDLAPERRKGVGGVDRRVTLPVGGQFPEDLIVTRRLMPIPYNLSLELSMYASNTQQLHQILEQILVLFDPQVQIQTNDENFDWTKLTTVELQGIQNESNYPVGQDRRMIIWSMSFTMPIWLTIPMDVKADVVRDIFMRFGNTDQLGISEFDDEGNLVLFEDAVYGTSKGTK